MATKHITKDEYPLMRATGGLVDIFESVVMKATAGRFHENCREFRKHLITFTKDFRGVIARLNEAKREMGQLVTQLEDSVVRDEIGFAEERRKLEESIHELKRQLTNARCANAGLLETNARLSKEYKRLDQQTGFYMGLVPGCGDWRYLGQAKDPQEAALLLVNELKESLGPTVFKVFTGSPIIIAWVRSTYSGMLSSTETVVILERHVVT